MNENHSERIRLAADRLDAAEKVLVNARKAYYKALKAWEATAQVKLTDMGEK